MVPGAARLLVEIGDKVGPGEVLNEGSIEPKQLLQVAGLNTTGIPAERSTESIPHARGRNR